jgi:hypothetical protein
VLTGFGKRRSLVNSQQNKEGVMDEEVKAKVDELGGWVEGDMIRFPTVDAKWQFERWLNENSWDYDPVALFYGW